MGVVKMEEKGKIVWRNVIAFAVSWAIWIPFQTAAFYYEQPFLLALGATPFIISIISATSTIILAFSRIIGGYLSDAAGRRRWIVSMTLMIAATYFLIAIAPSWEWYLLATILSSIALFYQPAINAILSDSLPKDIRGRGITAIHMLSSIVALSSPFIALYFVSKHGIEKGERFLFLLAFVTGVIAWLIRIILLEEVIKPKGIEERSLKEYFEDLKIEYKKTIGLIMKKAKAYLIFVSVVSFAMGMTVLSQLYVLTYLKVSPEEWSFIMFVQSLIALALMLPSGYIVDRFGRKIGLIIQSIFFLIYTLLLSIAVPESSFKVVLVAYIAIAIATSFRSPTFFSITSDILPEDKRAKGFAVMTSILGIFSSISSVIAGFIYEKIGFRIPFIISSILFIISFIAAIKMQETLTEKI